MPRNFYLPFSLFIKVRLINVHSGKGRRHSGRKNRNEFQLCGLGVGVCLAHAEAGLVWGRGSWLPRQGSHRVPKMEACPGAGFVP